MSVYESLSLPPNPRLFSRLFSTVSCPYDHYTMNEGFENSIIKQPSFAISIVTLSFVRSPSTLPSMLLGLSRYVFIVLK